MIPSQCFKWFRFEFCQPAGAHVVESIFISSCVCGKNRNLVETCCNVCYQYHIRLLLVCATFVLCVTEVEPRIKYYSFSLCERYQIVGGRVNGLNPLVPYLIFISLFGTHIHTTDTHTTHTPISHIQTYSHLIKCIKIVILST